MKKIIFALIAMFCILPFTVNAADKVKVYIFSKDGCSYCEKQISYLKGLEGYNKTFEIVDVQIYDSNWKQTSNYELAKKVISGLQAAGVSADELNLNGTPSVIISNIYAKTAYSANLEDVIKQAAEKGDKDLVGCYKAGKSDCTKDLEIATAKANDTTKTSATTSNESIKGVIAIVIIFSLTTMGINVAVTLYSKKQILTAVSKKK